MELKYLFKAGYKDGSVYVQNAEDRSVKEPEKRSCYYDVDHENLEWFTLTGDGHEYGVDLRDGHFEIDGVQFFMHEKNESDNAENNGGLKDFRLIFYRTHTHSFNQKLKTGEIKETNHTVVYRFGWQAIEDGKNYQQVMQIN